MFYFAYGSNLHPRRLSERVGEVAVVATGTMREAGLRFHKVGRDGSGKCTVVANGASVETVHGAVYRLSKDQMRRLDRFESRGSGYERHVTEVHLASGEVRHCSTYLAQREFLDERLRPFFWYRTLVTVGARYHGLPQEYLAQLERHPARVDPDHQRAEDERERIARMLREAGG